MEVGTEEVQEFLGKPEGQAVVLVSAGTEDSMVPAVVLQSQVAELEVATVVVAAPAAMEATVAGKTYPNVLVSDWDSYECAETFAYVVENEL